MKNSTFIIALFFSLYLTAQNKKSYTISRTDTPPKIDGILDDNAWQVAQKASHFVEFRPTAGKTFGEEKSTIVQMTYDDEAIYIAGYCKDKPEDMMQQVLQRDSFGQSDFFAVLFNPNNDAQNDTSFFVFSSGTQADAIANPNIGEDFGWNAVWESATKVMDDGWIVEMKIPYSALRFSKQESPTWGIQFHRHFRKTREQSTWSTIDPSGGYPSLYHGLLKGLNGIQPPVRLSFYPFVSGIVDRIDGKTDTNLNAGLDIKYGITDNFTIDATLIPDFSQAAFDNVELNLGPFEQQFSEQRQFFKEGVDLFSKGDLFYSRRVGNGPAEKVALNDNEELVDGMPKKINMLNAVKLSGRTRKSLGIGIFNAITEKAMVTIKDTLTQNTREVVAESLANYNIIALDQQFNKNSSVSLVNTNVTRKGNFKDANVTAVLLDLTDKKNTYGLKAESKISNTKTTENGTEIGLSGMLGIGKKSGKYQYFAEYVFADKKYDINDLGILFRNNFSNINLGGSYRIFKPIKHYNNIWVDAWAGYRMLKEPNKYSGKNIGGHIRGIRKKHLLSHGFNFNIQPGKQYDFFGPREDGKFFITENWVSVNKWISSNYNKTFALDINLAYETLFQKGRDYNSYSFALEPRLKLGSKFLMTYRFQQDRNLKDQGYVKNTDDDVIYGQRDQNTITNTISANYNFNEYNGLVLSFRNYWSVVNHENELFTLKDNGRLTKAKNILKTDIDNPDVNFNTWNLNLTYTWQFAPGSFLTAQYRNRIFNKTTNGSDSFSDSLNALFEEPTGNTLSIKLVYFLDYVNMKQWFGPKKNS